MKRTNLSKFGERIFKLSKFLLIAASAMSVAAQTVQKPTAKIPDKKKTLERPNKTTSPEKSGDETRIENGNQAVKKENRTIGNDGCQVKNENQTLENEDQAADEAGAPNSETERHRIVDRGEMKKRRSSFPNCLLAPFRAVAPFTSRNVTRFENNQRLNRLGIVFANPYTHPLIGGWGEGSGFGGGVEVSTADKLSDDYKLFASASATFSGYAEMLAGVEAAPRNRGKGKVKLNLTGRYLLRPKEDYFGTGANSFRSDHTSYFRREHGAKFDAARQVAERFKASAFADFSLNSITDGKDETIARITARFNQFDTPGLTRSVRLLDSGIYAEYEGRDEPKNPRAGTYLYAAASTVDGLGKSNDYGWLEYNFDARGYVPLGSTRRVLALRLLGNFKDLKGNSSVPPHRLARLGGATLRGYESYRYQGLNALHLNVEYRFTLMQDIKSESFNRGEAILFSDLGQVFNCRKELALAN